MLLCTIRTSVYCHYSVIFFKLWPGYACFGISLYLCEKQTPLLVSKKQQKVIFVLSVTICLTFYITPYCSCIRTPSNYASSVAREIGKNKHEYLGLASRHYNTDYSYLHWWWRAWQTWQIVDIHIFRSVVIFFTTGDICMMWMVLRFISTQ